MVTYKQAGVDIAAGNEVVQRIRKYAKGIGLFSGLYPMGKNYLVGAADGVGTKLKLAFAMNKHDTVGIDLVAMNVNDVICCGAQPIFFLDYIGCQKVVPNLIEKIIRGISKGCSQAGCPILGGETAELADMYLDGEYDLAGFAVGLVEKSKMINGSKVKPGDRIIGIASSGLHSNGYTLARKILFEEAKLNPKDYSEDFGKKLGEVLLTPTKIYVKPILNLIKKFDVRAIAHITGGGIPENLARVLPKNGQAVIEMSAWQIPQLFRVIRRIGKVDQKEMYKTFNMGIGMIVIVPEKQAEKAMAYLKTQGEKTYMLGMIEKGKREVIII